MLQRALDTGYTSLKKFRYFLWYGLMISILTAIISINLTSLPSGLSAAESQQAITSSGMSFSIFFDWTINGLYSLIQYATTEIFGITRLGLVLPSLIFAVASIVIFSLICVHWFKSSVALLSTFIVASSTAFISLARSATPDIMLVFWSGLLLYAGLKLLSKTRRPFLWKIMAVVASIGLIYTPLGVYPLLSILLSAILHPHVRSRIRRMSHVRLLILAIIAIIGLAPLVINLIMIPSNINHMLALDTIRESLNHLPQNIVTVYNIYFNPTNVGFIGSQVVPVFSLVSIVLMLLGIFRSIVEHFTARSYVLLAWTAITLLVIILLPKAAALIFLPAAMLIAIGIETLIAAWFNLFPLNPYARVVGLIPLSIIFVSMTTSNIAHYYGSHLYIEDKSYNQTIEAVQQALRREGDRAVMLVSSPEDEALYRTLKRRHKYLTVTSAIPSQITIPTLVTSNTQTEYKTAPSHILTSGDKEDSELLRVYRPQ